MLLESWSQPKYRASQILSWVHDRAVTSFDEMVNLPKALRSILDLHATLGTLIVEAEQVSKVDGTIKRAYRLADGGIIESVLMADYEDGRRTACVSSQVGCAMGCVFCATGQMGFSRQLTSDEIYEQVVLFDRLLRGRALIGQDGANGSTGNGDSGGNSNGKANNKGNAKGKKKKSKSKTPVGGGGDGGGGGVSNVVMMGMGEPLANYKNVMSAIRRMNLELGIGARRITVSTVGVVHNIRKLVEDTPKVRLAVSLHCVDDEERTALIPANRRYGGVDELLSAVRYYIEETGRRVTFEWALIAGTNDGPEVARSLGRMLVKKAKLRPDMIHVNLIPLNPTGGFDGSAPKGGKGSVREFARILTDEFRIAATARVRRGIDIDAGCGQLTADVERRIRQREQEKTLLREQQLQDQNQQPQQQHDGSVQSLHESINDNTTMITLSEQLILP